MTASTPRRDFQAVILGGDLGAYALARQLNDAYGIVPILLTAYNPAAVRDSSIVRRHPFAKASEEGPLIGELLALGADLHHRHPGIKLLLLANTDWRIHVLADHRTELERWYVLPIPSREVIEQVGDKQSFARLAAAHGMNVPRACYEDFSHAGAPGWRPEPVSADLRFPVVAKPANSADYENLLFEGRQKVYQVNTPAALDQLWHRLADAGFRGVFLAQEMIPGDDTQMYSVTAYVDSTGCVSLLCSARVLLEEHHPATLGNPCAMITEAVPEILGPAERFLAALPYRGFANFDVKRDPRSGVFHFLEVNPRIGRNSFYVMAAGVNPMRTLVTDVIDGKPLAPVTAKRVRLYSIIPQHLLMHYLVDPALRRRARKLQREGRRADPLQNPRDASPRREFYRLAQELNQYRKFRRYYPRPTATGL